jgi:hypothetical protein
MIPMLQTHDSTVQADAYLFFSMKGEYDAPSINSKIKKGNEDAKTECPNDNPTPTKWKRRSIYEVRDFPQF